MITLSQLFSPCAFGHDDPIKVTRGKHLVLQCPRCCQDLRTVLKGQKFKQRKPSKALTLVQKVRAIR